MGLDHAAGTTDMLDGIGGGGFGGRGFGRGAGRFGDRGGRFGERGGRFGRGGRGRGGHFDGHHDSFSAHQPGEGAAGAAGSTAEGQGSAREGESQDGKDGAAGAEGARPGCSRYTWVREGYVPPVRTPHSNGAADEGAQRYSSQGQQYNQQQHRQYFPRPRPPSLLQKLLSQEIR